jgi:hypothetical protein
MVKVEREYVDSKAAGEQVQTVYTSQLERMDEEHEDQIM